MKTMNFKRRAGEAIFFAALMTAIAAAGWLDDIDCRVSDWLYQKSSATDSDIVVVGIDSETLSARGPLSTWLRRDIATLIERLNEAPPAVIGMDFLFTGESSNAPEVDAHLAEVVKQAGNVVTASAAIIDDYETKDPFELWNETLQEDAPFAALNAAAYVGHICEPCDADGLVRHQLLYINVIERGQLYSFARVIYETWCRAKGLTPNPAPSTEGNGLYYLPFTAKSFDNVSFIDALEGKVDADFFRDKIVLIGSYAPGMGDEFPTALDRSYSMFGIDIHANAIEAFRRGFFPREVDDSKQLAMLFVVSFMATLLFRGAKMRFVLGEWAAICSGWIVVCLLCYRQELILHALWTPLCVSVIFIGNVAINYVTARAEKDLVTTTFGRYVDPTIMRQLLDDSGGALDVGGSLRNIAVLFVDIRGFTTMSEQLEAPAVVEILNQYLTLTTNCIRRHHGTLDKFVGDCTMAFWNAPLEQEKPVHLACRAALDMIEDSAKLRAEIKRRFGREINFGIGVHWGSAVVGNIGSPFRMDYTAIGDTVNTAARLEANAPGGKILISRAVADILGEAASVTSLGDTVKLKGKAAGFEVLILHALRDIEEGER